MLERQLGRPLVAGKPGPKPRVERDSARQTRLLRSFEKTVPVTRKVRAAATDSG
jgi:hypothetical protein